MSTYDEFLEAVHKLGSRVSQLFIQSVKGYTYDVGRRLKSLTMAGQQKFIWAFTRCLVKPQVTKIVDGFVSLAAAMCGVDTVNLCLQTSKL